MREYELSDYIPLDLDEEDCLSFDTDFDDCLYPHRCCEDCDSFKSCVLSPYYDRSYVI